MVEKKMHFQSARLLAQLYCGDESNLALIEDKLGVSITTRDDWILMEGEPEAVAQTELLFQLLNDGRCQGLQIKTYDFLKLLQTVQEGKGTALLEIYKDTRYVFQFKRKSIVPKTLNQKHYIAAMKSKDIVFGIGPAGTGKTYLAVAAALDALQNDIVERLILTRPAVEAGEALGFLPGDLQEKIQPYLRPLYDAVFDMLGKEMAEKLMGRGIIEIAPIAYMRGRTLSNACVILDEAQNTTPEQMMMFLTRLGEHSRMIITGDITQIDLPRHKYSGLKEAIKVLSPISDIRFHYFEDVDVVRNPLVQKIIKAYDNYSKATGAHQPKSPPLA